MTLLWAVLVVVLAAVQTPDGGCPFDWARLEPMSTFRYPNVVCVIPVSGRVVTLDLAPFAWTQVYQKD